MKSTDSKVLDFNEGIKIVLSDVEGMGNTLGAADGIKLGEKERS